MHRLLRRQIRQTFGLDVDSPERLSALPAQAQALLKLVSASYDAADADRQLLEHALDQASAELVDRNRRLASDLAAKEEAERALRASRRRLEFQRERMALGFIEWSADWRIVEWNPAAEGIFGYRRDEVVGKQVFEVLVPPDDREGMQETKAAVLAGTGPTSGAARALRRDGTVILCEWTITRIFDDEGEVVGIAALVQDVTERERAQAALRRSEERHALAVAAANDGIWDIEFSTGTAWFSSRCMEMVGWDPATPWTGIEEWLSHVHTDERPDLMAVLADPPPQGFQRQVRVWHVDGRERWVLVRGLAVRADDGCLLRIVGAQTDITDRRAWEEELLRASLHDALTGLPNRRCIVEAVDRALARYRRDPKAGFAVIFLDVDRFKAVNDSLGHVAGDQFLVALARRLVDTVRAEDLVARISGDEFAVLVEGVAGPSDALRAARRISAEVQRPIRVADQELLATASLGVAVAEERFRSGEEMLRDADIAMYRAKAQGRGGALLFDGGMHEEVVERIRLEQELRLAIGRGELRLVYQPIVELQTGVPAGFEALLRWRHPVLGDVSPGNFIPLAEETGLITDLSRFVVDVATRRLASWLDLLAPNAYVSINLSARELVQPEIVLRVAEALARQNLPPSRLGVEITETSVLHGPRAAEALRGLRALGVRVFMDDFGTGYASIGNLLQIAFDVVKIDRTFLEGARRHGEAFLHAVVRIAESLGKEVVVEGIEGPWEYELARRLGARFGQGYHLVRPLEAEDVDVWLKRGALIRGHDR